MTFYGYGVGLPYTSNAAGDWFGVMDKRLELMSQMTGNETPDQLAAINALDKQYAIQEAQAKVEYEYTQNWIEANDKQRKKNGEQKRNLFNMGAIFC